MKIRVTAPTEGLPRLPNLGPPETASNKPAVVMPHLTRQELPKLEKTKLPILTMQQLCPVNPAAISNASLPYSKPDTIIPASKNKLRMELERLDESGFE